MSDERQNTITVLGDGRVQIVDGDRQRIAYAVVSAGETWIFLDGRTYVVGSPRGTSARRGTHPDDAAALSSPMPATVVDVKVEPGQQVRNGDVLLMLEAMKMELPVRAQRDGRVKAVLCRPGELVQPGVPLLELE